MIEPKYLDALIAEIRHANSKHGNWANYSPVMIHKAVADEYREMTDALIRDDLHGQHGMKQELLQVAVTAFKGYMVLHADQDKR